LIKRPETSKKLIEPLKKSKVRVKVFSQKTTLYEYQSEKEVLETTEIMCELIPRRIKNYNGPVEPNSNTLKFPLEFRRKRKKREERVVRKPSTRLDNENDLNISQESQEK